MYFLELFIILGTFAFICVMLLLAWLISTRVKYGMWFPPRDFYGYVDQYELNRLNREKTRKQEADGG